MIIFLNKKSP